MDLPEKIIDALKKENRALRRDLEKVTKARDFLEREKTDAFIIGDSILDGICDVDARGVVTSVNRGYTEITGIPKEEIVGKSIREMLDRKYFSNAVSLDVIEKRKKVSAMATIYGNNKTVLLVGTPFLDKEGNLVKVLTVMRDLTELLKLKEELEDSQQKKRKYKAELQSLKEERSDKRLIGHNPAIVRIRELIEHVSQTDATVLITGETGAGKEVVAREIYKLSKRKDGPYIKVNCSAIPENLLESEMFGYVKGAFTGADNKDKRGLFEMANGGTILLDEISEMPLKLQPKILRVLQEREFTRVGGTENIRIDVRVIASTNKNLIDLIRENLFRVDLYYRLNVFPINMPPLRERIEDIPDFVANFLLKFNLLYGKEKAFSHEAIRSLMSYAWPGNVRELENIVERLAVISTNAMLTREDVEGVMGMGGNHVGDAREHVAGQGLKESVREFERRIISRAISDYGDSYSAARALKTTQPTIVRKAQALGIPLKRGKSKN